ncbi:Sporulation-specific SPO22, putative [Candida maltosa Xu316]|uniref:Protein ZIP4 homolog n=1 Tax=Candida maltosa (strain Xu316) TaxID=1245528 RepID=M3JT89_CANMX|nr:Sporulation-specific SPO22, putative [Candida maltosa Xu316]
MSKIVSNYESSLTNFNSCREIHELIISFPECQSSQPFFKVQTILDVVLPLVESTYRNIENAPPIVHLPFSLLESLEANATELWNVCATATQESTIYEVKLFSLLLRCIYELLNPNIERCLVNVSCFVNLFSLAITRNLMKVANKCNVYLEPIVSKLISLDKDTPFAEGNKKILKEYHQKSTMLNLNYAVLTNSFALVRTYEKKLGEFTGVSIEPSFVVECSRILYNHSLTYFQNQTYEDAKLLIAIAIAYLEDLKKIPETFTAKYLQCYILLAKCYKSINTPQSNSSAKETLNFMRKQFPDTFEVYHLYFEICDDSENEREVEDVLMQLVSSIDVHPHFDKTIDLLKTCINKSFKGVNKCLDYLLTQLGSDQTLCETLVVSKFAINSKLCTVVSSSEIFNELNSFCQHVEKSLQSSLSVAAKTSVVAILWSQGMKSYKQGHYEESTKWFQLALSRIFYIEYSENQDRGKLLRAIQNNYYALGKYNEVITVFESMNQEDKKHVLTQYNLFRAYLMLNDEENAMKCISMLHHHNDLLSILTMAACILESKGKLSPENGKNIFISLVENMVDFEFTNEFITKIQSNGIFFSACCRCAVVMYTNEIENSGSEEVNQDLLMSCQDLLEKCCEIVTKLSQNEVKIFTVDDLEWLASKAYNFAIYCQDSKYALTLDFCKICIGFIDLIPPQIETPRYQQILLWKTRANILGILHSSSKFELNTNEWNEIRLKCMEIKDVIHKQDKSVDWLECLQQVSVFHFQAELSSGSIQNLTSLIDECKEFNYKITMDMFNIFINLIVETNRSVNHNVKKKIIHLIIEKAIGLIEASHIKLIITWVRYLFECCDQAFDNKEEIILLEMYKLIKANKSEIAIPTFEIEWLATTCWNFGIVTIDNDDKEMGLKWCSFGVILSRFVHERLQQQLNQMWQDLTSDQNIAMGLLGLEISKYE